MENQQIQMVEIALSSLSPKVQKIVKSEMFKFYDENKNKEAIFKDLKENELQEVLLSLQMSITKRVIDECKANGFSDECFLAGEVASQIYYQLVIALPHAVYEDVPVDILVDFLSKEDVYFANALTKKLELPSKITASKVLDSKTQNYLIKYQFDDDVVMIDSSGHVIEATDPRLVAVAGKLYLKKYNLEYFHTSEKVKRDLFDIAIDRANDVMELANYLGQDQNVNSVQKQVWKMLNEKHTHACVF